MKDIFLITQPHITEKAVGLNQIGKYVFIVKSGATKNEIRKAVKDLYKVDAEKVHIVNSPAKPTRFRGVRGKKERPKKAIVTLKGGQKIDLGR